MLLLNISRDSNLDKFSRATVGGYQREDKLEGNPNLNREVERRGSVTSLAMALYNVDACGRLQKTWVTAILTATETADIILYQRVRHGS